MSSWIIEKFNGHEIIKNNLSHQEKIDFRPIDIVYEPSFDESTPVVCNFTPKINLAYKSYMGKMVKGEEKVYNRTIRQCYYCQNYFSKSNEAFQKHLSFCAAKEGITYSFDNAQIIDYQDNFKYLGDVPFCVYFNFETTTGSSAFFYSKMYVVSNCQIVSSNPALNLDKIVIYREAINKHHDIYIYI